MHNTARLAECVRPDTALVHELEDAIIVPGRARGQMDRQVGDMLEIGEVQLQRREALDKREMSHVGIGLEGEMELAVNLIAAIRDLVVVACLATGLARDEEEVFGGWCDGLEVDLFILGVGREGELVDVVTELGRELLKEERLLH